MKYHTYALKKIEGEVEMALDQEVGQDRVLIPPANEVHPHTVQLDVVTQGADLDHKIKVFNMV